MTDVSKEVRRHQLYQDVQQLLRPESADELMDSLPPVGWGEVATKADLGLLQSEMAAQVATFRGEMSGLRGEMSGLRGEMSGLRGEMSGLRGEMSQLESGLRVEFGQLESGLRVEFGQLESGLRAELAQLEPHLRAEWRSGMGDLREVLVKQLEGTLGRFEARLLRWTVDTVIAMIAILFALFHTHP